MYYMKEGHFFQRKKKKTSLFKKVIQVVCCTQDNCFHLLHRQTEKVFLQKYQLLLFLVTSYLASPCM